MIALGGTVASPAEISSAYSLLAALGDPVGTKAKLDALMKLTEEAQKATEELRKAEASVGVKRAELAKAQEEFETRRGATLAEQQRMAVDLEGQKSSLLSGIESLSVEKAKHAEAVRLHEISVANLSAKIEAVSVREREIAARDLESQKVLRAAEALKASFERKLEIAKKMEAA